MPVRAGWSRLAALGPGLLLGLIAFAACDQISVEQRTENAQALMQQGDTSLAMAGRRALAPASGVQRRSAGEILRFQLDHALRPEYASSSRIPPERRASSLMSFARPWYAAGAAPLLSIVLLAGHGSAGANDPAPTTTPAASAPFDASQHPVV